MRRLRYVAALFAATVLYLFIAFSSGIRPGDSVLFVCLLWGAALSIRLGESAWREEERIYKDAIKESEGRFSGLSRRLEDMRKETAYLEKKLDGLSKLYAITKEMSSNLRFKELLKTLENFLDENFKFGSFKIALFGAEDGKFSSGEIYEIGKDTEKESGPGRALRDLANFIVESKKPALLKSRKDLFNFGLGPETRNLAAIPLIAHRKAIAALLIENIEDKDYDRFLILARQVALEIERIRLFDNIERRSMTDGLTGTFLRRYFMERLEEELERARHSKIKLSIIIADLDHFKECNDTFGHLVGDVVLKEVAQILKENVRGIDIVARYGGEEFCVLLPESGKAGAYLVAERIREAVQAHTIKAYDEKIRMTLSMGISSYPENSRDLNSLIENADKALYEAKRQGRNRVSLAP